MKSNGRSTAGDPTCEPDRPRARCTLQLFEPAQIAVAHSLVPGRSSGCRVRPGPRYDTLRPLGLIQPPLTRSLASTSPLDIKRICARWLT